MPESDKDRELEELKQRVAELENSERPARGVAFHDVARKADKGSQVYYLVIFIVIMAVVAAVAECSVNMRDSMR